MMRPTIDLLRANAAAHAASSEWIVLRHLLTQHEAIAAADAQLATLRAEAELRTGRPREAHQWIARVLSTIEQSGDRHSRRRALNLRAVAALELGELEEAQQTFVAVLELAYNDGDELLTARVLNNLGALADMRDRLDDAVTAYEQAIPAYQRLGDARGLAETHHNLAMSFRHHGQTREAEDHERQAIGYAREARHTTLESLARLGMAELKLAAGDAPLAEAMARHAADRFVTCGDGLREADAFRVVAAACLAQHKLGAADDALRHACQLAVARGARLLEAELRQLASELYLAVGRTDVAREAADQAAQLFEQVGSAAKATAARRRAH